MEKISEEISSTLTFIIDKICSSTEVTKNIKSSNNTLRFKVASETQCCLAPINRENKQNLEESSTQNCSSLPTSVATSVQFNSAAKNSCLQISSSSTSSTSSSKNNQKIKLQKMEQQPKPVPRILPKKSFVTTKQPPKLFVLQQSSSSSINENEKNVQQQQIFRGISSTLISTTNHPPSIKINTSKLVSTSTSSSSSLSSLNNTITTSTLSMSFKNVCNTTSCGSSSPKIVFTLKPSPSTSVGNINDDNNKGIKSTSFTPNSIAPSSSKQQPPLCKTPPKNKKISVKRPAQLNTTTNKNFSSSSPLLDSNDSLTNTVNKVAAGADISPTNLDQNTTTNTQTNIINKSKQIKKKTCTKPRILCDEQKVKGGNASICNNKNTKIQPVVPCISPKIVGASPPQTQSTLIPLESAASSSSSEIATTTNTIYNSNLQTLPSSGMLLPGSQFALNGNLVSGMHYFIRQPTSAVGNSVQQQQQQFVPLMSSQPIFFSPVDGGVQQQQQQDVQQTQQVTSPTKFSPTNLMTTRNVFLHTGNGLFIPTTMFSQQNFVGIQNPRPFLPTTTTTLTSISSSLQSSGSSKFVLQLAKSSNNNNNLTSTIMPNILPKNSGKGKTIISTSIASNNVTVNENTILSSPPCQKNQQQQNQFLPFLQEGGGGNIYINNQQYLQQLLNIQQQNNNNDNMKGNLFLQNIDGDVINKKIEGGGKVIQQQQKKQTRTRKKKGENNNVVVVDSNSTNVLLNNNKIPPKFNDMTTTSILQQQQPEQFDEEENEPPPVLCRGEISSELSNNGTKSIENVFQKEAKIIREKMFDANGKKYGPIVHDIDGFCIEEDVEPFPCENQEILEKLIRVDNAINNQQRGEGGEEVEINNGNEVNSSEENINSSSSSTNKNSSAELNISNNTIKKRHRKNSSSSSEEGAAVIEEERSLSFSKSPPIRKYKRMSTSKIDEKQQQQPTNKRRRELENLLKMDFGPGKTPFQTSDPDEYAEEVLGGRKRTLALAAEEKIARKSMERPGSSSKKRDKDKSLTSIISSFNSNEKQQEKEPRRSDESIEEGCCSYCRKPFSEVGRDKEHEQYCSKECRRNKKYAKKLLQKQKILEENNKGIVNEKTISLQECSNNSSLKIVSSSSINSTTTISSPIKSTTPNNNTTTIKTTTKTNIITSPLGSAFSTLQPQMLATNKNNILLNNSTTATKTLNEQTAQILVQKQLGEQIASIAQGFEIQSSSSSSSLCNEQQQKPIIPRPYGAPFNLIPHVSHPKQIITTLPLQQQPQHLFAAHFHPHAAGVYLSGQDSTNTNFASFLTHSQSPPNQQPQLIMPTPFVTSSSSSQQHLRQQFLQSPINTPTPPITTTTNNNNNEKNVEIETLIAKSIFTWTSEEVSKWVNFITNSESNGERFIQQEIDGSSLVLLTCEQLQNELKLKLGPAVKLNNALNALKSRQPYI